MSHMLASAGKSKFAIWLFTAALLTSVLSHAAFTQDNAEPPTAEQPAVEPPADGSTPEESPTAQPPAPDTPAEDTPAEDTPASDGGDEPAAETAPATDAPADELPASGPGATDPTPLEPGDTQPPTDTGDSAADAAVEEELSTGQMLLYTIAIVAVIAVPFWLGSVIGNSLRMPDHGWKIGFALVTLVIGVVVVVFGRVKLGPDLAGGINLIYEVSPDVEEFEMSKLIGSLVQRVNPGGVKEVTIRPYGQRQVEIIIPNTDPAERDLIKRMIITAGALEFRIAATERDPNHKALIDQAMQVRGKSVKDGDDEIARWVSPDPEEFDAARLESDFVTRENAAGQTEVLVVIDGFNVTGDNLDRASSSIDQSGRPSVNFVFNSTGTKLFGDLTTAYRPMASGYEYKLGIVLDGQLRSAPNLREPITGGRGEISGSFTQEEVNFLIEVLNAGSLPSALVKTPISEQSTDPLLGADTIRAGAWSMGISMAIIVVFMLIYYRFAGIVACIALILNLILLLSVMILIKAAFTLPGIAGLVLTVGMAVDANVLIFERIREERARGAALRMAIRNGFGRATTTIVDANLTTLITAVVLYWIGTDQIRGFAVTLILGIVMSMYTAIFCSRILFDIAEKKKWITELRMGQLVKNPNIDFLGRRRIAFAVSLLVIVVGMFCVVGRGANLLDIDFLGGTSITLAFDEDHNIADVRKKVEDAVDEVEAESQAARAVLGDADLTISNTDSPEVQQQKMLAANPERIDLTIYGVSEGDRTTDYKVETSIAYVEIAQAMIKETFAGELRTNSLEYEPLTGGSVDGGDANGASTENDIRTTLTFGEPIKHDTVAQYLEAALETNALAGTFYEVTSSDPDYATGSAQAFNEWDVRLALPVNDARQILDDMAAEIGAMTVFPSSNKIGGRVAADMQQQAGYALFASLLFIVGYIWLRFQRIMFGLAAVVALAHDVLVTLGMLAISAYIYNYAEPLANILLIDPFKISLSIVAAFLTIIGYSLNDTIVVFDRIREVRGKSPDLTADMINTSINQTLSRTLLTSMTTLIVVAILYVGGGPGIHAFAFSLVIGVLVGTYSSIFVASPVLLWMSQPKKGANSTTKTARVEKAATS